MRYRILIVDPDPRSAKTLGGGLAEAGFEVASLEDGNEALDLLRRKAFDLILADQDMGSIRGIEFIRKARTVRPESIVILLTGFGTIEEAVEAMRVGAFDYLAKPIVEDQLGLAIQRALEKKKLLEENRDLKEEINRRRSLKDMIGTSERMGRIFETIESVAPTRATVLITGESGTGKTRLARTIHALSKRNDHPFVEVNCGALPDTLLESELFGHAKGAFTGAIRDKPGKFEEADQGTIFLDEIATASPALQVKLLRLIQDRSFERVGETLTRKVDVRILLATNRDLLGLVRKGKFREDLYYRINVVNIELPPLRERQEDIPFLLDHFLQRYRAFHEKEVDGFTAEALDYLMAYEWPGNIREIENAVERAVVLCRDEKIDVRDLPPAVRASERPIVDLRGEIKPLKEALEEPERRIILEALERNGWNRQKTADMLEVNRSTLFHKMKKYGLLPEKTARKGR